MFYYLADLLPVFGMAFAKMALQHGGFLVGAGAVLEVAAVENLVSVSKFVGIKIKLIVKLPSTFFAWMETVFQPFL